MKTKKRKTPFLDFYNIQAQRYYSEERMGLPNNGLCVCFHHRRVPKLNFLIKLFEPQVLDEEYSRIIWGDISDEKDIYYWSSFRFNTFRQNVVLFCAAMNGELK